MTKFPNYLARKTKFDKTYKMYGALEYNSIEQQIDIDYYPKGQILSFIFNGKIFKKYKGSESHFIAYALMSSGRKYNLIIDSKLNNL